MGLGSRMFAMMSRATDISWAAGLFEGEGCVSRTVYDSNAARKLRAPTHRKSRPPVQTLTASLVSTDRDVLDRFVAIVGVGHVKETKRRTERHKVAYRWMVYSDNARHVIALLWRHLGSRRRTRATELWNATVNRNEVPLPCGT